MNVSQQHLYSSLAFLRAVVLVQGTFTGWHGLQNHTVQVQYCFPLSKFCV